MKKNKITAIVLAAGHGKRMKTEVAKQYLLLNDKPIMYYSLMEFEQCEEIDEIVLVVGESEIQFCKESIIDKYNIKKVINIIAGGKERYQSVYNALISLENTKYVLIHDGARPFVNKKIIIEVINSVKKYKACIVGVSAKDTIKIANKNGFVETTPLRENVWSIQTPQAFEYILIKEAYDKLILAENINVTDDAMVLESMTNHPIKIVEGSYRNIKLTTPEDLVIAQKFIDDITGDY